MADSAPPYLFPAVVAKAAARRGRVHAYERIAGPRTALVVVDLTAGAIENDPACAALVPRINALAAALRAQGGAVAWVVPVADPSNRAREDAVFGAERAALYRGQSRDGDPRAALAQGLATADGDLHARKSGFSAFFPGRCDLDARLRARGIDTVLIAGTVTNVCCESSARDAVECGYRTIMVADGNAGHAHGLHDAALNTFYRSFGDVYAVAELVALIAPR